MRGAWANTSRSRQRQKPLPSAILHTERNLVLAERVRLFPRWQARPDDFKPACCYQSLAECSKNRSFPCMSCSESTDSPSTLRNPQDCRWREQIPMFRTALSLFTALKPTFGHFLDQITSGLVKRVITRWYHFLWQQAYPICDSIMSSRVSQMSLLLCNLLSQHDTYPGEVARSISNAIARLEGTRHGGGQNKADGLKRL